MGLPVVIIRGILESGKTTFEEKCMELVRASSTFWFDENKRVMVEMCSTVDFVKKIALEKLTAAKSTVA